MQIGQAQVVRNNWYDRALTFIERLGRLQDAGHVAVSRLNYTVPANRVAVVTFTPISVHRTTGAGILGTARSFYSVTPNGGALKDFGGVSFIDNTVNFERLYNINSSVRLVEGDEVEWNTEDTSTGGQCWFIGGFLINEYNA